MSDLLKLPSEAVELFPRDEEEWKLYRTKYVTGSQAAVVMDDSPWMNKRRLAQEKLGLKSSFTGNHLTRMGQLMEEANLAAFATASGFPFRLTHSMLVRGNLSSTLDCLCILDDTNADPLMEVEWRTDKPDMDGSLVVVDGKNVKASSEKYWEKGPPRYYWWQMQDQMYTAHLTGSILMAKVDAHRLLAYYIPADDFAIAALVERAGWFLSNLEAIAHGSSC